VVYRKAYYSIGTKIQITEGLEELPSGSYLISIQSEDLNATGRILKI
jgi:hypothetical protein